MFKILNVNYNSWRYGTIETWAFIVAWIFQEWNTLKWLQVGIVAEQMGQLHNGMILLVCQRLHQAAPSLVPYEVSATDLIKLSRIDDFTKDQKQQLLWEMFESVTDTPLRSDLILLVNRPLACPFHHTKRTSDWRATCCSKGREAPTNRRMVRAGWIITSNKTVERVKVCQKQALFKPFELKVTLDNRFVLSQWWRTLRRKKGHTEDDLNAWASCACCSPSNYRAAYVNSARPAVLWFWASLDDIEA